MMTTHWMSWRQRCWKVSKRDSAAWLKGERMGAAADLAKLCFRGVLMFLFGKQEENLGIRGYANWEKHSLVILMSHFVALSSVWRCQSVSKPFGSYQWPERAFAQLPRQPANAPVEHSDIKGYTKSLSYTYIDYRTHSLRCQHVTASCIILD